MALPRAIVLRQGAVLLRAVGPPRAAALLEAVLPQGAVLLRAVARLPAAVLFRAVQHPILVLPTVLLMACIALQRSLKGWLPSVMLASAPSCWASRRSSSSCDKDGYITSYALPGGRWAD